MPREIRATAKLIQLARRDWYAFHYDQHEQAGSLTQARLQSYQHLAALIAPPLMTIYGGVPAEYPERRAYYLASQANLNIHLVNPWYLTPAGWQCFQALWAQLPEPIDILSTPPCVQVGELYTLSTVPAHIGPPT